MNKISLFSIPCFLGFLLCTSARGDVSLPNLFGDHMVLQREQANPVWGWANPGEEVTVSIHGQSHSTVADSDGSWRIELEPIPMGGPYEMTVSASNTITFEDVLVGEVWVCSGQSNMAWPVSKSNHAEIEIASANYPKIRLLVVRGIDTQKPQNNFKGQWEVCSPETVGGFSAVGYLFGRRLYNTLGIPIGLIKNAQGASGVQAWISREALEKDEKHTELLQQWDEKVAAYSDEIHATLMEEYQAWEAAGRPGDHKPRPKDPRTGHHRPANIFHSKVHPIIGYGIRGVIWYQGEGNASRGHEYRDLFPLLIETWRNLWQQGDFPFYWAQLADFGEEQETPGESGWAEVREAQTMTLSLPNTGQAVTIDTGEGRDIHPRDKQTVANRLAGIALARDYGYSIHHRSPRFAAMEIEGNTATLRFEDISGDGLRAFDVEEPLGFTVAGEDGTFHHAQAKIVSPDTIRVQSPEVSEIVAVRYAWANNPVANVLDSTGLPLTPFRTDDWTRATKAEDHPQE